MTAPPGVQRRAALGPPTPGLPRLPCPRHTGDSHSAATDSQLVYDVAKLMEVSRELANVVDSRKFSEEYEVSAQWFAVTHVQEMHNKELTIVPMAGARCCRWAST